MRKNAFGWDLCSLFLASIILVGCQSSDSSPIQSGAVVDVPRMTWQPIEVLGREGFAPAEVILDRNEPVVFLNKDQKVIVLTFQKDGGRIFINSDPIAPGGTWRYRFEEGEYDYWSLAYGGHGRITVR